MGGRVRAPRHVLIGPHEKRASRLDLALLGPASVWRTDIGSHADMGDRNRYDRSAGLGPSLVLSPAEA